MRLVQFRFGFLVYATSQCGEGRPETSLSNRRERTKQKVNRKLTQVRGMAALLAATALSACASYAPHPLKDEMRVSPRLASARGRGTGDV